LISTRMNLNIYKESCVKKTYSTVDN